MPYKEPDHQARMPPAFITNNALTSSLSPKTFLRDYAFLSKNNKQHRMVGDVSKLTGLRTFYVHNGKRIYSHKGQGVAPSVSCSLRGVCRTVDAGPFIDGQRSPDAYGEPQGQHGDYLFFSNRAPHIKPSSHIATCEKTHLGTQYPKRNISLYINATHLPPTCWVT